MLALSVSAKEYVCAATNQRLKDPHRMLPCLCIVNFDAITAVGAEALKNLPSQCPNPRCKKPVIGIMKDPQKAIDAELFYDALKKDNVEIKNFPTLAKPIEKAPLKKESYHYYASQNDSVTFSSDEDSAIIDKIILQNGQSCRPKRIILIPNDKGDDALRTYLESKGLVLSTIDFKIDNPDTIKCLTKILLDNLDFLESDHEYIKTFAETTYGPMFYEKTIVKKESFSRASTKPNAVTFVNAEVDSVIESIVFLKAIDGEKKSILLTPRSNKYAAMHNFLASKGYDINKPKDSDPEDIKRLAQVLLDYFEFGIEDREFIRKFITKVESKPRAIPTCRPVEKGSPPLQG